jgi:predicted Zn-dependent peptidase
LGDILLNSIFPEEKLKTEKAAILHEISTSNDMPSKRINSCLKKYVWGNHPISQSVLGDPDTLRSLTREDVIYFTHTHYLPDRIIIAAAGNIDHHDFVAQVRDAFWRLMGKSDSPEKFSPDFKSGVVMEPMPVSQTYFSIGIRAGDYTHQDRYLWHILNKILGGGISSRLFRSLREEKGLVYNIGSEYQSFLDAGLLVVDGSTTPECIQPVLEHIFSELQNLAHSKSPISIEELWKAKMQIRGQHLISGENTNTCMSRLATQAFYFNRYIPDEEILENIDAVDKQNLQSFIGASLAGAIEKPAIAIVGPEQLTEYNGMETAAMAQQFVQM